MAKLTAEQREALKNSDFAVPGKRALPVHDAAHTRLAWQMLNRTEGLSAAERDAARKRILAAAKKFGIDTGDWHDAVSDAVACTVEILSDAAVPAGVMRARFKGTQANVVNENHRLYPLPVLKDAVDRLQSKLPVIGEMPHPKPYKTKNGNTVFDSDLSNSVLKITEVSMDGAVVNFVADILDTTKGRDVQVHAKQGLPVPVSMRMIVDSVKREMSGLKVDVATYLDIFTFDVVGNAATTGCGLQEVLTDSQIDALLEVPEMEESSDGVTVTAPMCPECGAELVAQDPDGDGDVDFLTCAGCDAVYMQRERVEQHTSAVHVLEKMTAENYDAYPLAREWLERHRKRPDQADSASQKGSENSGPFSMDQDPKIEANSAKESGEITMDKLKQDPEFLAHVADEAAKKADEKVKPLQDGLDLLRKERDEEKAQQKAAQDAAVAKERQKAEASSHLQVRFDTIKAEHGDEILSSVQRVVDDNSATKEEVDVRVDTALKMAISEKERVLADSQRAGARAHLDSVGFTGEQPATRTRVEVGETGKPWKHVQDGIQAELDRCHVQRGGTIDPALRKWNRENVLEKKSDDPSCRGLSLMDRIEETLGRQALCDNAKIFGDSGEVAQDSITNTTSNILNQPTILQAILVQAFQDAVALQFINTEIFKGSEWRVPVETFTSAAVYNTANYLLDLAVAEGSGIPSSQVDLRWLSFTPTSRKNAMTLTDEVISQLASGPLNYSAIARALYHIAQDKMRRLDLAAYYEMILTSDEYLPAVQGDESPAAEDIVTTGIPAGSNAAYRYALHPDYTTSAVPVALRPVYSAGYTPIVRPRSVRTIGGDGSVTTTVTNPFTVRVDSDELVEGVWDGTNIMSFPNTTATYAVDYENGWVYFKASSGVDPEASTPVLPVIEDYSASTNFDRWHYTLPEGETENARWYDTLIQQISTSKAIMGSSPRFKVPNVCLFSLNSAVYAKNAKLFYQSGLPSGTKLLDTGNTFGTREGINFSEINAPWAAGDGRILLTQRGATKYGIETPYKVEGPFPQYDTTGKMIAAKGWYGREASVLATPVVKNSAGVMLNPPSRTVVLQP